MLNFLSCSMSDYTKPRRSSVVTQLFRHTVWELKQLAVLGPSEREVRYKNIHFQSSSLSVRGKLIPERCSVHDKLAYMTKCLSVFHDKYEVE